MNVKYSMAGRETIGFLTESSLLPKKAKAIDNVGETSMVQLRSIVYEKEQGLQRPEAALSTVRRAGDDIGAANKGVGARNRSDILAKASEVKSVDASLARKTLIYDIISGRLTGGAALEAIDALDPTTIPAPLRRQMELALGFALPRSKREARTGVGMYVGDERGEGEPDLSLDVEEKRYFVSANGADVAVRNDANLIALAKQTFQQQQQHATGDTGVRAAWERVMSEHEKQFLSEFSEETTNKRAANESVAHAQAVSLLSAVMFGDGNEENFDAIVEEEEAPESAIERALLGLPEWCTSNDDLEDNEAYAAMQTHSHALLEEDRRVAEQRVALLMEGRVAEVAGMLGLQTQNSEDDDFPMLT